MQQPRLHAWFNGGAANCGCGHLPGAAGHRVIHDEQSLQTVPPGVECRIVKTCP